MEDFKIIINSAWYFLTYPITLYGFTFNFAIILFAIMLIALIGMFINGLSD